jgi:GAF domain-containing protein
MPTSTEHPDSIARDVAAVDNLSAVPKLLEILCNVSGLRFAAVARVSDESWTACAVRDGIEFGLVPGAKLDLSSKLFFESHAARAPFVIDRASTDPRYRDHPTPRAYGIESFVSVPIILPGGRYFGSLCAIDREPANPSDPRILALFAGFAELIGAQLELEFDREQDNARDQSLAVLGHDLRNPLQAVSSTAALLERRLSDPELIGLAARIRSNVRAMSALIDDALELERRTRAPK